MHVLEMSQVAAELELASENQPVPPDPVLLSPIHPPLFLSCPNQPALGHTHSQGLLVLGFQLSGIDFYASPAAATQPILFPHGPPLSTFVYCGQ